MKSDKELAAFLDAYVVAGPDRVLLEQIMKRVEPCENVVFVLFRNPRMREAVAWVVLALFGFWLGGVSVSGATDVAARQFSSFSAFDGIVLGAKNFYEVVL